MILRRLRLGTAAPVFFRILGRLQKWIPPLIYLPKIWRKAFPNRGLEVSWGVLEPSWRVLGTSWGVLGASWRRPGGVLGASWAILGAPWGCLGGGLGRLRASWGRPETVLERLGSLLGHLGGDFTGIKQFFRGMSSWKPFFIRIFVDFASKNQARTETRKTSYSFKKIFFALRLL